MLIPVRLRDLGELAGVAAGIAGHGVHDGPQPESDRLGHLRGHRVDVAEVELRLDQDRPPAVDDEVFVAIGDAQLGRVDVAEDGPDEGHGPGSGETEVTDQPPSILSSCPVTTRDSSDRK